MKDGREVANYVLDYAESKGFGVTNLSLQKIVYFCHAWYLVSTGGPLVKHSFEAWEYGPVLPYLYRDFKSFGDKIITTKAKKLDVMTGRYVKAEMKIDEDEERLLMNVVAFYSSLSPSQLVALSHHSEGPWSKVWNFRNRINPGMKISNEEIMNFYSSQKRCYTVQ
ncbi:type II toxin-antitoxin system antitoxin SocA domain-containing protein [uncultured Alcanivorax sp.]|uniref:Panacea domain-containing protein n=1 Tax=uncultured Alcanivorax sp. TaxID=191215 RepID=UPI002605253C|nr:type II toxin-antitoxin system antitoxin SocA domain-containing protein [uncultured Alcanivorax sp.]